MSNARLAKMIYLLQQRTDEQKIVWENTVFEDVYQVAFPSHVVQVGHRIPDPDSAFRDEEVYFIRILDEQHTMIEEATNVHLKDELENSYRTMENLYRSARGQAMGVDKAINSILSELQNHD